MRLNLRACWCGRIKPCPLHKRRQGTEHYRGGVHTAAWALRSRRWRAGRPFCEDCLAEGRYVQGQDVHHVTKRKPGQVEEGELMTLCRSHHVKRTRRGE